jgi:hypothetical protein
VSIGADHQVACHVRASRQAAPEGQSAAGRPD